MLLEHSRCDKKVTGLCVWQVGCRRDWKGHVGRIRSGRVLTRNFKYRLKAKYSFGKTYEGILFRMSVAEILAMMLTVRMMI